MQFEEQNSEEKIITLITRHQAALHAYILSLLPQRALADDVLQETNIVLWRKAKEYDPHAPFLPWAFRIAYFQVKAARRDSARDRHIFDPDLLDQLAAEASTDADPASHIDQALRECLQELPTDKRQLILQRYQPDSSVHQMANFHNISAAALSAQLHRIRQILAACVQGKTRPHST